jgi:hypothetical protein
MSTLIAYPSRRILRTRPSTYKACLTVLRSRNKLPLLAAVRLSHLLNQVITGGSRRNKGNVVQRRVDRRVYRNDPHNYTP